MEPTRFDDLVRSLTKPASRRGALGVVVGGALAAVAGAAPGAAKHRHRHGVTARSDDNNQGDTPKRDGLPCVKNAQCQSGQCCGASRGKPGRCRTCGACQTCGSDGSCTAAANGTPCGGVGSGLRCCNGACPAAGCQAEGCCGLGSTCDNCCGGVFPAPGACGPDNNAFCTFAPAGLPCKGDAGCGGANCVCGTCCIPTGDSCEFDEDCCSGRCASGQCA